MMMTAGGIVVQIQYDVNLLPTLQLVSCIVIGMVAGFCRKALSKSVNQRTPTMTRLDDMTYNAVAAVFLLLIVPAVSAAKLFRSRPHGQRRHTIFCYMTTFVCVISLLVLQVRGFTQAAHWVKKCFGNISILLRLRQPQSDSICMGDLESNSSMTGIAARAAPMTTTPDNRIDRLYNL